MSPKKSPVQPVESRPSVRLPGWATRLAGWGANHVSVGRFGVAAGVTCYCRLQFQGMEASDASSTTPNRREPPTYPDRVPRLMAGLAIEREVLIEAPVEVVWRTITEPDQIIRWFADRVDLVVTPGAHGFMGFGDQGGPVVVESVDPPTYFSFRWNHPSEEEPVAGNSVLVEFTLSPEGRERTRLRVSESGLELLAWPDTETERYANEHQAGWAGFLERLAGVLKERQSG